nr:MAG TPA: hypothetical protein [Caudoviricetes sp.]
MPGKFHKVKGVKVQIQANNPYVDLKYSETISISK